MIPCIENKCLLLPTCRNQRNIECPDLHEWYNVLRAYHDRDETWNLIKRDLKEMRTFKPYNGDEPEEDPEGN